MRDMIGRGGFACVYRAQCNRTGQEVAIKMVRLLVTDRAVMQAAGMASRVGNEVEIHCRLKHPTIEQGCGSPAHVCIYMQLYMRTVTMCTLT